MRSFRRCTTIILKFFNCFSLTYNGIIDNLLRNCSYKLIVRIIELKIVFKQLAFIVRCFYEKVYLQYAMSLHYIPPLMKNVRSACDSSVNLNTDFSM